jgi:predicted Mrr-cat superfamily restriction endonuclease
MMKSKTGPIGHSLWGIRAGLSGDKSDAHDLFIKCRLIALKKQGVGDLRLLPKKRDAFYAAYESTHRDARRVAIHGIGGKFFRFIHEIQLGDNVFYPCRFNGLIYVGEVVGRYFYDDSINASLPHRRKVRWKGSFPKQTLSEFARREIGAARTLFRIKTHVEEFACLIAKLQRGSAAGSRTFARS